MCEWAFIFYSKSKKVIRDEIPEKNACPCNLFLYVTIESLPSRPTSKKELEFDENSSLGVGNDHYPFVGAYGRRKGF
jgi:hypothetical protein